MRLLWWGDGPTAATGFGTVSRNVLAAIHGTGKWDIVARANNYYGQGHPFPYMLLPSGYPDGDPFGKKNVLRDLASGAFDLFVLNNDTYVAADVASELRRVCDATGTRFLLYYPVDLQLLPSMAAVISAADVPVAYSRFGLAETKKILPDAKVAVIPHGCETVPPMDREMRRDLRKSFFGPAVTDEHFIWVNVNRNSVRKDLARSIEAFAAFHAYQPSSILYLHTQAQDNGLDMGLAASDCGVADSIALPQNYSLSNGGTSREDLFARLRLCDGFITTHLGEGWGLTVTEAMAAELPVVAPRNTTMPEILGEKYPYLYPCADRVWVDNTGMRPRGTVRAIYDAMRRVHDERGTATQAHLVAQSLAFTREYSWEAVGRMWLELIGHVMQTDYRRRAPTVEVL